MDVMMNIIIDNKTMVIWQGYFVRSCRVRYASE